MPSAAHRLFCRVTAWASTAWSGALLVWPAVSVVLPAGPLAPLHARCIGAMHLALALGLWAASRRVDEAAARLPLWWTLTWAAAAVLAALLSWSVAPGPAGLAWLVGMALAAGGAGWLLKRQADGLAAPAEHLHRGWLTLAVAAGTLAMALLLAPGPLAPHWPWPLQPVQAAVYGAPLLGLAAMAWAAARERRLYVREPASRACLALAAGLLLASLAHGRLFDSGRAVTWAWFAAWTLVLAWAATPVGRRLLAARR